MVHSLPSVHVRKWLTKSLGNMNSLEQREFGHVKSPFITCSYHGACEILS